MCGGLDLTKQECVTVNESRAATPFKAWQWAEIVAVITLIVIQLAARSSPGTLSLRS